MSKITKNIFPLEWKLSDNLKVERHNKKVFGTFVCGGGSTMGYKLAGFNVYAARKGPDSVRNGIKNLQNYQIIVDPESKNLANELQNYIWSDKKSETPVDKFNHLIDAIRYAEDQLSWASAPIIM